MLIQQGQEFFLKGSLSMMLFLIVDVGDGATRL
jgi:hypothetical protein